MRCLWMSVVLSVVVVPGVRAQIATVGGGVLVTERGEEWIAELHAESPPLGAWRAYATLSWTDDSAAPTVIAAAERPVIHMGDAFTGVGAGFLLLEVKDYEPDPMLVSTTVVPLPIPRTSFVFIGSTLPFDDWDWSLVFKLGVTVLFVR